MRIEDYGLIGDLQTAALVGRNGSIDWLCFPRFDSGACFAALLGGESNGRWLLTPDCEIKSVERRYRKHSLVHELDFHTEHGSVRVTDFMPPRGTDPDVVRIVEGLEGSVPMRMELVIRFDYGRIVPWVRRLEDDTRIAIAGPDAIAFRTPVPLRGENMSTVAEFTAQPGERVPFVLTWFQSHLEPPRAITPEHAYHDTCSFWGEWLHTCSYTGRYAEAVFRSLTVLKAMMYGPTGGIVAAPTTSLPEQIGGVRNWDYRFCWLRDASFALAALLGNGFVDEAGAWRSWLLRAVAGDPDDIQIMYGPAGERRLTELELDVARRVRGLAAGPGRQRCERPAAARCLRRGARHALPGTTPRARRRRPRLDARATPAREPRAALARARRGHLGGAGPEAPLHPLQGDGVGGVRPRPAVGRRARPSRPRRTLARRPGRDQGRGARAGIRRVSSARSSSRTARNGSTRAC